MRNLSIITLLLLSTSLFAQNTIDWDGNYQLQLSDFQSPSTSIGKMDHYSIQTGVSLDYEVSMTNAVFAFTKNFNDKVNNTFHKNAAVIIAPDSSYANNLLELARFDFDLAELYARKFRKKVFEEKKTFSDMSVLGNAFNEIFDDLTERRSEAFSATDVGQNSELLEELHQEVLKEIGELPDYCKTCKPEKKKKKK